MFIKKSIFIATLMALVSSVVLPAATYAATTVQNTDYGFILNLPSTWTVVEQTEEAIIVANASDSDDVVRITFFDVPSNWNSSQAAIAHTKSLEFVISTLATLFGGLTGNASQPSQDFYQIFDSLIYADTTILNRPAVYVTTEGSATASVSYFVANTGNVLHIEAEKKVSADYLLPFMDWNPAPKRGTGGTKTMELGNSTALFVVGSPWVSVLNDPAGFTTENSGFSFHESYPGAFIVWTLTDTEPLDDPYTTYTSRQGNVPLMRSEQTLNRTKLISYRFNQNGKSVTILLMMMSLSSVQEEIVRTQFLNVIDSFDVTNQAQVVPTTPISSDLRTYGVTQSSLTGTLVKTKDSSTVYLVHNGKRYSFPNQRIYRSWYGDSFSGVTNVTSEELAQYQLAGNVTYKPGSLIKIPSISKVYLVTDDGGLRWIPTEEKFKALGLSFGSVEDLSEGFFFNYTIQADI